MLFVSFSCSAGDNKKIERVLVNSVVKYYFSSKAIVDINNVYFSGDFNQDGYADIAVLIKPAIGIKQSVKFVISEPWSDATKKYKIKNYTSLAIINGSSRGFMSNGVKVFVLLDHTGVLETPAFQLIVKKISDKDYSEHARMLPLKIQKDFIILPTEAGIDTYVYWDKGRYSLYEPEEEP